MAVRLGGDWPTGVIVPRVLVDDDRLSLAARGVVVWLAAQPAGEPVTVDAITEAHTDDAATVETALRELRDLGYLVVERVMDAESGRLVAGTDYVLQPGPGRELAVRRPARAKPLGSKGEQRRDDMVRRRACAWCDADGWRVQPGFRALPITPYQRCDHDTPTERPAES